MKHYICLNFLCAFVLLSLLPKTVSSQGDRVTVERNGSAFFVHQVKKGHTLYSISKLYQTSVEEIEAANPGLDNQLQIDQSIYIPVPEGYNEKKWTNPIRLEDGFMIHKVMRKETMYGICREYTLDVNRFLELNPEAEKGIRTGMELRIPVNDLYLPETLDTEEAPDEIEPTLVTEDIKDESVIDPDETKAKNDDDSQWKRHYVQQGETLYGICRLYKIDQKEFIALNGGLTEGLKAGMEVLIPIKEENSNDRTPAAVKDISMFNVSERDSSFLKSSYNVVVMLPFSLDELQEDKEASTPSSIRRLQEIAMQFYYGTKAALDSLENQGARLNVTYLDVTGKSDIAAILEHPAVRQSNLIIGPLQRTPLEKVSNYASKKGIHIVCPVPQSNKVLLGSPNLSKVQPSVDSQMRAISSHVFREHRGENIVLINSKEVSDVRMVEVFKRDYQTRLRTLGDSTLRGYTEMVSSNQFVGDLQTKLNKSRRNVLVVPAGEHSKSMVANLQTKIQLLSKDYDIVLYAPEGWLEYDFLDLSFKERVHLTVPVASFVDYDSERTTKFVEAYREAFDSEATDYSILGFDVMLYYGRGLHYYGLNFPNTFGRIPDGDLMGVRFQYRKTGMDSGFENQHTFLVRQHNFHQKALGYE